MTKHIRIGMIGLDTSHCEIFTELLHNPEHPYHVPGARVTIAYPGGSPDFKLSASRVAAITASLQEKYGVILSDSLTEIARQSDAILLTSVDGRAHVQQFAALAPFAKPVFIDKPLAVSALDGLRIMEIAKTHGTPWMSSSSLRFAEGLMSALQTTRNGPITGAYCFGPMPLQPVMPGLFWYGIHAVEMLFTILGKDWSHVTAVQNQDFDVVTAKWADGRMGVVRGDRTWNQTFGALIHYKETATFVDIQSSPKPYYASLLEQILHFFRTGIPSVDPDETLSLLRFLEAANESRRTGRQVYRT